MAKTPKLSDKTLPGLAGLKEARQQKTNPEETQPTNEPDKTDKKDTHTQISAYIPNELYKSVRVALVGKKTTEGGKLTLTDLLIKLLSDWERENG